MQLHTSHPSDAPTNSLVYRRSPGRSVGEVLRFFSTGILGGLMLAAALLVYFQDWLVLPSSRLKEPATKAPVDVEEQMLESGTGVRIRLWHYLPSAQGVGAGKNLLYVHGNGDSVARSEGFHRYLAKLGYHVYAFDYRGTGASSGRVSEAGLYADADTVTRYIDSFGGGRPLSLLGRSFGTGIASYIASRHAIEALVLISPYLSIPKIVKDRGLLGLLRPFLHFDIPAESFLKQIGKGCVILAHGAQDEVIRIHHAEELVTKAGVSLRKILIPNADHDSIFAMAEGDILRSLGECYGR